MKKPQLTDPYIRNLASPAKRVEKQDHLIPALYIRVTPAGHKSFVYRYRFGGKIKRYTIGTFGIVSLSKARDIARDIAGELKNGIDPLHKKREKEQAIQQAIDNRKTVADVAKLYISNYVSKLRSSTQNDYKSRINAHILPAFGNTDVKAINTKLVREWLNNTIASGKSTTANRNKAILSSMLSFAVQDLEWIDFNPILNMRKLHKETARARVYNADEICGIWQAIDTLHEPARTMAYTVLICGQRRGETAKMKWNLLQYDSEIETVVWTIPGTVTKNKIDHFIPMPGALWHMIEKLKPITGQQSYVFNSLRNKDTALNSFSAIANHIQKHSGVKDFRFHDLRRTFATGLARNRTPEQVTKAILNHQRKAHDDITNVYNRYDYLKEKLVALQNWFDYLQRLTENSEGAIVTKIA